MIGWKVKWFILLPFDQLLLSLNVSNFAEDQLQQDRLPDAVLPQHLGQHGALPLIQVLEHPSAQAGRRIPEEVDGLPLRGEALGHGGKPSAQAIRTEPH